MTHFRKATNPVSPKQEAHSSEHRFAPDLTPKPGQVPLSPPAKAANVLETGRGAAWLARLLGVQEVVGSNPAGPTFANGKPFDQEVEGLSPFWGNTYVNEGAVQPGMKAKC
jgi:hypothetical protein